MGERPNRRNRCVALVEAAVLVLALVAALSACGRPTSTSSVTAIVVAHHAHELAPRLTTAALADLRAAAADPDTDGVVVHVVAAGGGSETVDLEPRRPGGDIERGQRVDELVGARLDALVAAVERTAAASRGTDLLGALDAAAVTGASTILVLSSGISTTDPLDLRVIGWDRDPEAVAADLAERRALPRLAGRQVVFGGLARTAGAQPPLGLPERATLREVWLAVCRAAGAARCSVDDGPRDAATPTSAQVPPVVAVPVPTTAPGPGGTETVEVPAPLLFLPDRCDLRADGTAGLAPLVERLRSGRWTVAISGRTAPVGPGDGIALSTCRAERAAAALRDLGAPPGSITEVRGDGAALDPPTADVAALRRVVFTLSPVEEP